MELAPKGLTVSDPLFPKGEQEAFKLLVHLGLLSLGVTCMLYSVGAFLSRRERHLAVNAGSYIGLTIWEVYQINRHWETMCEASKGMKDNLTKGCN